LGWEHDPSSCLYKYLKHEDAVYHVMPRRVVQGGYNVIVPAISEICIFGEILEDTRGMAKDAIRCFLGSCMKEQ